MAQLDLWVKQATNLSLPQALFLVAMCLFLTGLVASIDHWEGDD